MQLFSHGYVFLNGKCCVLFVHTVLGGFTPKKTVEEELTKTSTRVHAPGEDQYLEGLMSADPHWPGKRVDVARRQARGTVENHGEHAAYVSGTLIYIYSRRSRAEGFQISCKSELDPPDTERAPGPLPGLME